MICRAGSIRRPASGEPFAHIHVRSLRKITPPRGSSEGEFGVILKVGCCCVGGYLCLGLVTIEVLEWAPCFLLKAIKA